MARNGKIARLPRDLREELNRRMRDGGQGGPLLAWLNAEPAVQTLLAQEFAGCAISKQNLSEWRAGGFTEWEARQDTLALTRELAAEAGELEAATEGRLTDQLATVLAARYAALVSGWNGVADDAFLRRAGALRTLCREVVELRRGDHSGERLRMEQERLAREREKTVEEVVAHFERWAADPRVREWISQETIPPEERAREIRRIFGMAPPVPTQEAPGSDRVKPGQTGSNRVKPGQTGSNRVKPGQTG